MKRPKRGAVEAPDGIVAAAHVHSRPVLRRPKNAVARLQQQLAGRKSVVTKYEQINDLIRPWAAKADEAKLARHTWARFINKHTGLDKKVIRNRLPLLGYPRPNRGT